MSVPWYVKVLLLILFVVTTVLCFVVGAVLGYDIGKQEIQIQAVDRGHADYDLETGEWRWKSSQ